MITSEAACKAAAAKLGLGRVETDVGKKGWPFLPPGCSSWGTRMHYNYNVASTKSCDHSSSKFCICTSAAVGTKANYNFDFNDRTDSTLPAGGTQVYTQANSAVKVSLRGWTHTRKYAGGFLNNVPGGSASATVSNLIPNKEYHFKVYQYASPLVRTMVGLKSNLIINGQDKGLTAQLTTDKPSLEGKVTATSDGKVEFRFKKNHRSHVNLSKIKLSSAQAKAAVVYSKQYSGNCKTTGKTMITSEAACKAAAAKLGLGRVETDVGKKGWPFLPPGCSSWGTRMHYNYNVASTKSCDHSSSKFCICTSA